MDTVSNGGFLQFSAGGILSPLPGDLARDYGPCDYDIRHNLNAQYVYQLPLKFKNRYLAYALNGWQVSGTVLLAQRDSFFCSEHAVFRQRQWNRQRQRAAIRQRDFRRTAL